MISTMTAEGPALLPVPTATPASGIRPVTRLSSSILDRYLRERHHRPEPVVHDVFDWFAPAAPALADVEGDVL